MTPARTRIAKYLAVRRPITGRDANALFLSSQNERISRSTVHAMVKKRLGQAGIDPAEYCSHKLRHTAATLMLQNGVDVRAVQEVLGHDHLNTTEIYTHIDNESLRVAAKANPLSHIRKSRKKRKRLRGLPSQPSIFGCGVSPAGCSSSSRKWRAAAPAAIPTRR